MLDDCAKEIRARGGTPIPIQVDHSNDKEVEALFQRIKTEQKGQLDLLVNNAYAGVHAISSNQVTISYLLTATLSKKLDLFKLFIVINWYSFLECCCNTVPAA